MGLMPHMNEHIQRKASQYFAVLECGGSTPLSGSSPSTHDVKMD